MSNVTIYHNPRCSKSRATLNLLKGRSIDPTVRLYLEEPLSKDELFSVLKALDAEAEEVVRKKEALFKELSVEKIPGSESEWQELLLAHPSLLERPIVVAGERAAVGRPPENVLSILPESFL